MQISHKIQDWIQDVLKIEKPVTLVHPKDLQNGDFTFIVNNGDAEKYFETLKSNKIEEIEEIKLVAPRFINIYLSKQFFQESIQEIIKQDEECGETSLLKGQKVIVEYTNTNVLKPMHIGHLMGNVIGQSVSNILEKNGAEIKRNTYQGDTGLHIAKAVWGIKKLGGIIDGSLKEKIDYVGRAYALGSNSYEDDDSSQEEIKEINKKIFDKKDQELLNIYEWGKKISLDHFEELYKKLNTKFDYYFFESEIAYNAVEIVKEFLQKGVFEESEGAIVFRGENFDLKLHTRVFISSQGIPMYEAKDIAHALRKEEFYKSDKSIIITANEQDEYFKVVLRALEKINLPVAQKTKHLSHGLLKLPTGKMSSRKGNVITGESLISEVENMIKEKLKDREFSEAEKQEIAEMVAIGAIKYSILRQAIGGDIIFDFDKSISFEGDSGPYLQYTAVRANSVLAKVSRTRLDTQKALNFQQNELSRRVLDTSGEVYEVERLLYRFGEVVERAGREYAPHYLVTYLTELASSFNSFYANEKIIDEDDPALARYGLAGGDSGRSPYKIALTQALYQVLKNGLNILGVKVPERM